ncbi:hypothetical protein FRC10_011818 [Ceratobasidium sp. 414]|nr:hypothetical protein FRC10_011818 [Ceratobasidium sp. 414]
MFSTIDMRDTLGKLQPQEEKPRSIFIDHFRKVSRSKLARAKSAGRLLTKKQTGPKKRRSSPSLPPPPPELVHDNTISEESTPVSTPTHPEFDFRYAQGQVNDKKVVSYGKVLPPASPLASKSKNQVNTNPKVWRGPYPPAPRIDTGTFDNTFHDSHLDASLDSSTSFSNDSSMDIPFALPSMDRQMLPSGLQNLDTSFSRGLGIELGVDPRLLQCPPAPRPDTGSWSYVDARGMGPFLPGVPAWMNAQAYRFPIPAAGPTTPSWSRLRAESSSYLNPSVGWNMGHGLDLHSIADIPGPSLGENMFVREVECEQCLMGLFPSMPRPPRCVPSPALAWTTHGMKFDAGRRLGASHVLVQEAGMTRMFDSRMGDQGGYLSAALGYGLPGREMHSVRAEHIQNGAQSVWTRPVEPIPIVLTETAVDCGGLLPPIELGRRRVGM